jgi:DNA modification methylase
MTAPYYQDSAVTIYHGDCRQIMEWLKADVLICDPPFGIQYNSGWQSRPIQNDGDTNARDEALLLWGDDKPALVFGQWRQSKPGVTKLCLTWDKGDWPGMGDLNMPWGQSTEEIYVIGNGFVGPRGGTVIRVDRLTGSLAHPNEKPIPLFARLLEKCPPGLIADPFMGSGTTLRAAKDLGRKAIGIEIEEKYCEIAAKRMAQEVFEFV